MRKSRRKPKQPAADDSNATPRPQTSQSEAVLSPKPRTTIPPQPLRPAEQQQPQRSGPVTRSSGLAPIEKKRGRTFSREEARKRSSSLGALSKGKKTTRKTEAQLRVPSKQEVGLEEVLQVAPVTLQDPTNPPSGTEATAVERTQTEMSCDEDPDESNNAALEDFSESVRQATLVQLWESASCCRNNETPNCRTRPEECARNEVEQFFLEELYEILYVALHTSS